MRRFKLLNIFFENLKLIIIALISIILVIIIAILLSLTFGGDVIRQPSIADIKGIGYVYRDGNKMTANKRMKIKSGDIISTDDESFIRVFVDNDKYVVIEENSSASIYFTEVAEKGIIDVSITEGSVLCQLNNPLKKKASFKVKTPNAMADVRGTVFRASFTYADKYMGYEDVYITEINNFAGSVNIQLYDYNKEAVDLPMLLIERASAKMITGLDVSQYIYLNHDTDMFSLPERTLIELLRISTINEISYSTDELNTAYKAVLRKISNKSETTTEITNISAEISATTAETTTSATSQFTDETSITEIGTLATTRKTHAYTTFSGEKWWEIPYTGDANFSDDNDFDDGGILGETTNTITYGY